MQVGGVSCCPGEISDCWDRESEQPDGPDGEGDELPPNWAGSPEGIQRPLPEQHHEESGWTTESTAHPERETAQGCFFNLSALVFFCQR